MQSKALDKSVKRAPDALPLSTDCLRFPVRTKRLCLELNPLRNPH